MDILVLLNKHLKKLEKIEDAGQLDELIKELKNLSDTDIKKSLNQKSIPQLNELIQKIISRVEELKKETLNNMEESDKQLKGLKAYTKNYL